MQGGVHEDPLISVYAELSIQVKHQVVKEGLNLRIRGAVRGECFYTDDSEP